MRKCVLVVILLYSVLGTLSAALSIRDGAGVLEGDDYFFAFSAGRTYFNTGFLSFGAIGQSGMIAAFSDPYCMNLSLPAAAGRPRRSDSWNGFMLGHGAFSIAYAVNYRPFLGVSLSSEHMDVAVLHAFGDKTERGYQTDSLSSTSFDTIYMGADLSFGDVKIVTLGSWADEIGFRGFASLGFSHGCFSLFLSSGSLIALTENSSDSTMGISGSFRTEEYLFLFSLSYGTAPVFSNDYRTFSSYASSSLKLGNITIYTESEAKFTKSGKRYHTERMSIASDYVSLGYDTAEGFFISLDAGHFTIGYEDENAYVGFRYEAIVRNAVIKVSASTDGSIEAGMRIQF